MKYALVNGQRQAAQPKLSGVCPVCKSSVTAKCGKKRAWHWSHQGERRCDVWWESETEWHRAWKNQFPAEWQEIVHCAENGERHIADVKTANGCVIEFQHSPIKVEERQAREAFYRKMIWVIDGTRRKTDKKNFVKVLGSVVGVCREPLVVSMSSDGCALFDDWCGSRKPVFLDFGERWLWCIHPKCNNGCVYVAKILRNEFIELHRGENGQALYAFLKDFSEKVKQHLGSLKSQLLIRQRYHERRPLVGFEQYWANKERSRRRF